MHDPQTRIPVALARAEAAWMQGSFAASRAEVDRVFQLAVQCDHGWWLGEVAWWSTLSGPPPVVCRTTEPHDLMLDGRWRAGADAWARHRNPFWRALCLAQSDDQDDARAANALLTALGASATLAAVQREWRRRGVPVPRGARVMRSDQHGLTDRELDVVELLGDGLSNADIAHRLVISERTAAHHVSAVLRKLDAPSRARAVAAASRLGLVAPPNDPATRGAAG
jgi:DNA-binding CsgD family transcriptional regulator